MADLKDLLARANAKTSKVIKESSSIGEDAFDSLEDNIDNLASSSIPLNTGNTDLTKDGNELEVGDPVVGMHKNQRMSGQVIAVDGDDITVEWRDRTVTQVKIDTLELSDVDDDYAEQTMYIEAEEPIQTMGFDKESFVEDTDLESLLKGDSASTGSSNFKYGDGLNAF